MHLGDCRSDLKAAKDKVIDNIIFNRVITSEIDPAEIIKIGVK